MDVTYFQTRKQKKNIFQTIIYFKQNLAAVSTEILLCFCRLNLPKKNFDFVRFTI